MSFDSFDRKILALLQADSSLPMSVVGERVGLSQSQAWRRVERLEKEGVIVRRVVVLDRMKLGLTVQMFTLVKLNKHSERAGEKFQAAVEQYPEVVEVHTVLGNVDFLLRIVTSDLNAYSKLLSDRLASLPMVQEVQTLISLSAEPGGRGLPVSLSA
ncbi:Lrp/AsnC family transcriptional regulator [Paraburkholderia tropica]|uniref:Lrp/AsnC family transcriptional regulator n=1 Tax=Paraburkholderia tropica TaxID=92647 RepID=UPI002AB09E31|nr:Lrp/AsnC family transcriptional regulator [Paraburkholderia tropica]